jgi:hypothetical protein
MSVFVKEDGECAGEVFRKGACRKEDIHTPVLSSMLESSEDHVRIGDVYRTSLPKMAVEDATIKNYRYHLCD